MDLCKTTEIHCKVRVPPAVTIIYVTAHNSKGSSKPANIIVKQPPHNYQGKISQSKQMFQKLVLHYIMLD